MQQQHRFSHWLSCSLALLLCLMVGVALPVRPVQAATVSVTNTNDSGPGSLRQAIADAAPGDTIRFNLVGCPCTITLTSGALVINKNLTIEGPGSQMLTVSGNHTNRVFFIASGTSTITIAELTVANGQNGGAGGAIRVENSGTFTLLNVSVINSGSAGAGGGLEFRSTTGGGNVIIVGSTFSGNSASEGGALHFQSGNVQIRNTTISGNTVSGAYGGGISNFQSNLTILNSTITGNSSTGTDSRGSGGGVINLYSTNITIANSIIAGNNGVNPDVGDDPNYVGAFLSLGHNLIGNNQGALAYFPMGQPNANGDLVGDSARPINPLLAPLANNGGPTLTHALLAGSPALNAGNPATPGSGSPACEPTDQRGYARPDRCDIGAFEVDSIPPTADPTQSPPPAPSGWNNTAVTVAWNWTDSGSGIDPANCTTSSVASGSATVTVTATCKDLAGNIGTASYSVRIDPTAPTANPSQSPAANGAGWNNTDITVDWNWTFTGAIIDTANCTTSSTSSGEGTLTLSATCKDVATNQRTVTYVVKVDKTAPVITGSRTPPANSEGWHNSAVTVDFTCQEQGTGSGLATNTVGGVTVSTQGANQTATNSGACVDMAGNVAAPATVGPINIDLTKPTTTAEVSIFANANGWFKRDVPISFLCDDVLSGIATCSPDEILSSEGAAVSSTPHTSSDKAGNVSDPSNIVTVKIDKTAPVVTVTGVSDGASYTLGSVPTAGCSTSDALSGVATQATLSVTGGNPDGTGSFTATCSGATDLAGNSAAAISVSYSVTPPPDSTAPVITPNVVGTLGNNGWYVSDATVNWSVVDNESTISNQSGCEAQNVTSDTVGVTFTCTAASAGGSSSESVTIKRDATAPVVTVDHVTDGATYTLGSVPTAACTTSDATSGVATQATVSVTGGNPDGTGSFTATCSSATDLAGNSGSASVNYTVSALVDACTTTALRDDFNRANGGLDSNWAGLTGQSFYKIAGKRVDVQLGGPVLWKPTTFGVNQAAFVTLSTLDANSLSQGVLLKVQTGTVPNAGAIAVVYDGVAKAVRVSTLRLNTPAWTSYGNTPATFANGDKLLGCVQADGTVRVYRNTTLLTTVTLNAADQGFFNVKGGKIGLWTVAALNAYFDDFGGGALTGVVSATLDATIPDEVADDGTAITVADNFPTADTVAVPDASALTNQLFLPLVNR